MELTMYYNGSNDYTDIYALPIGQNPSLTFNYYDLTNETFVMGLTTTMTYSNLDVRTQKVQVTPSGTTTINYILDGDKVLVESRSNGITLYFTYDVDGTLLSMNYNGNEYFYITNMQGDIIELVDINGNSVVKYNYDAWGNIIYKSGGSLADINPYRYRGYRYDIETGWYYLQSRYYNPEIGRFISSDGLVGEIGDPVGHNMYSYCGNNPVMYTDSTGYWFGFDDVFTGPIDELIVLAALALAAAVGIPGASDALGDLTSAIGDTISNIYDGIKAEKDKLSVLLAGLVIKNLSSLGKNDWHHIVAQRDPRAALSRIMLARCNIDVNSIDNMVSVSRPMHWVMHTTGYHASVTVLLWASYGIAGEDGVKATLAAIKIIIGTASGNIG
jgi:RHS repeat-associated protein